MSREIEINKNYDEFGKSFITSRKPYQLGAISGAFVVGVIVMLVLKPLIGATISSYIALLVVIPLGVIGVYEKHGLDCVSFIKKRKSNGKAAYYSDLCEVRYEKKE